MRLLIMLALVLALATAAVPGQGNCTWSGVGVGQPASPGGVGDPVGFNGNLYVPSGNVLRWNASTASWSILSSTPTIAQLVVFDDGGGPTLYGYEPSSWTQPSPPQVFRWDGVSWTPFGGLLPNHIATLCVLDDGSGATLYAAGTGFVARWDDSTSTWVTLGGLGSHYVVALTAFDDGNGPELYAVACGWMAKWDASASVWNPIPAPCDNPFALAVFDDGTGPSLYVADGAWPTGATGGVLRLTAASWTYVIGPFWCVVGPSPCYSARDLEVFDDGNGPALFASGNFSGQHVLARWDGQAASFLGPAASFGFGRVLTAFDDGTGPALWVGGSFTSVAGVTATNIAKYSCNSTISLTTSQPGGAGTPLYVSNANLTPGREYHNLVSIEPCPGGPMSFAGPYGSCLSNNAIQFLLTQLQWPVGTEPFHFIAPSSYVVWPPLTGLPSITVDALCIEMNNGVAGAVSPIVQVVVQ